MEFLREGGAGNGHLVQRRPGDVFPYRRHEPGVVIHLNPATVFQSAENVVTSAGSPTRMYTCSPRPKELTWVFPPSWSTNAITSSVTLPVSGSRTSSNSITVIGGSGGSCGRSTAGLTRSGRASPSGNSHDAWILPTGRSATILTILYSQSGLSSPSPAQRQGYIVPDCHVASATFDRQTPPPHRPDVVRPNTVGHVAGVDGHGLRPAGRRQDDQCGLDRFPVITGPHWTNSPSH